MELKKTSEEWSKEFPEIIVLDPDGWDRKNFTYSWYVEPITSEEYLSRRNKSTVRSTSETKQLHCPCCEKPGSEECLTSYPPYYQFHCSCGFSLPYRDRKLSTYHISQKELDEYYSLHRDPDTFLMPWEVIRNDIPSTIEFLMKYFLYPTKDTSQSVVKEKLEIFQRHCEELVSMIQKSSKEITDFCKNTVGKSEPVQSSKNPIDCFSLSERTLEFTDRGWLLKGTAKMPNGFLFDIYTKISRMTLTSEEERYETELGILIFQHLVGQ